MLAPALYNIGAIEMEGILGEMLPLRGQMVLLGAGFRGTALIGNGVVRPTILWAPRFALYNSRAGSQLSYSRLPLCHSRAHPGECVAGLLPVFLPNRESCTPPF